MSGIQPNNVWHGCGRLGSDPEVRTLPSGKKIFSFSIAIDRTWADKDGNKQKKTNWVRCVAFYPLSRYIEVCHIKKGTKVSVVGSIEIEKYTDQSTGATKQSFSIWLTGFEKQTIDGESQNSQGTQATTQNSQGAQTNPQDAFIDATNAAEEDLPF